MRLSELKNMIVPLYKTGVPVTLVGPPGIGKTDFTREMPAVLANHFNKPFGFVIREASGLDGPDVLGFPIPTKNPKTGEATTRYAMPDIIREVRDTGLDCGVVFIDEIGLADLMVQKALAPLYIDGRLGEYHIPEGWWVMSATNRAEDRAGVNRELSHFTNRQCRIPIEAVIGDWVKWATDKSIHWLLIAFAEFRPGVVMIDKVPSKPGSYCTPRSYTAAARFLNNLVDNDESELPSDHVTQQVVASYIGEGASAELFAFTKVHEFLPEWESIVDDPEGAVAPPKDRLDAAYACAGLITNKADKDTVDLAFRYAVANLPIEMQTSIGKSLIGKLGGSALNAPSLNKFISEHKSLILSSID